MKHAMVILLIFTAVQVSRAQFTVETNVQVMYDDNINNNALGLRDRIITTTFGSTYGWSGEEWNASVSYSGLLSYFPKITDRTFQYHTVSAHYTRLSGEEQENVLNSGLSISVRNNKDAYAFYDHSQVSAFVNYKYVLSDQMLGRAGYTLRLFRFSELPEFDYLEHYFVLQTSFFFPTQTTVILETDLGTKIYDSPNDPTQTNTTTGMGMWSRRGRMVAETPSVTQLVGLVRIGQGLGESTGLSLTAQYLINLQKETRYLTSEYGVISDDELFDDHYGYEGPHVRLMLTQLLGSDFSIRVRGGIQSRNYTSQVAYDLLGNALGELRRDTRSYVSVQVQKTFESLGWTLGLVYDFIRNRSNELYYDYRNNAVSLDLSVPF